MNFFQNNNQNVNLVSMNQNFVEERRPSLLDKKRPSAIDVKEHEKIKERSREMERNEELVNRVT